MERVSSGAITMTWDPDARLATIRFESPARVTGADARVLVDAISGWIGTEGKPFALLGDGGRLRGLDAEYRAVWAKFFQQHRHDSYLAFFNMNLVVRVAAEMFRIGTGLRLRAFASEAHARSWLQDMGIAA